MNINLIENLTLTTLCFLLSACSPVKSEGPDSLNLTLSGDSVYVESLQLYDQFLPAEKSDLETREIDSLVRMIRGTFPDEEHLIVEGKWIVLFTKPHYQDDYIYLVFKSGEVFMTGRGNGDAVAHVRRKMREL